MAILIGDGRAESSMHCPVSKRRRMEVAVVLGIPTVLHVPPKTLAAVAASHTTQRLPKADPWRSNVRGSPLQLSSIPRTPDFAHQPLSRVTEVEHGICRQYHCQSGEQLRRLVCIEQDTRQPHAALHSLCTDSDWKARDSDVGSNLHNKPGQLAAGAACPGTVLEGTTA